MNGKYVAVIVDGVLQDAECYQSPDGTISGYDWQTGECIGSIAPGENVRVFPVTPGKKAVLTDGELIEIE